MYPKGLSRQAEQKTSKLQSELAALHQQHSIMEKDFEDKSSEVSKLTDQLKGVEHDTERRQRLLEDENKVLRRENDATGKNNKALAGQVRSLESDLRAKSEDKDLLYSRHDALTAESRALQIDLSKARAKIDELEESLDDERQHALDNDRQLRSEAKDEINRLSEDIVRLRQQLENMTSQHSADQDLWESQRKDLQSQKDRADERANGLQRTVNKLQEMEGSLSSRETKLQQALESEKQRHNSEAAVLERQIQELNREVAEKRQSLENIRGELAQSKDDLIASTEDQAVFEEKIQALEDEIEVLQGGLENDADNARDELGRVQRESESLQSQLNVTMQELSRAEASHADTKAQLSSYQLRLQSGGDSEAALASRLENVEVQLEQTKTQKQSLQDRLATNNLELHALRTSVAEVGAERDEMKSQLRQMQNQVDETFRLDQEKVDLRTSVLRLENDVGRLREERKGLVEKNQATERELEAEIERASTEEGRLSDEVEEMQRRLASTSGSRDRELHTAKQKVERLEKEIQDLRDHSGQGEDHAVRATELELQSNLEAARNREAAYVRRDLTQKDSIRDLKQSITRLEQQIHQHEISRLAIDSPKSSVSGSARKSELIEVRQQLTDSRQQLKDLRTTSRETERSLQRRLLDSERQAQSENEAYEQRREQLEVELNTCRDEISSHISKATTTEKSIGRLRTRIANLESSLQAARAAAQSPAEDNKTLADERAELHEMLKDAKLATEDLQLQISTRQNLLDAASARDKEVRAQLKRIREERSLQSHKSTALASELDSVQASYEAVLEKLMRKQHQWDEERKAIVSKVRFTNMSISEKGDSAQMEAAEKRHGAELRGLATQIQWLRARLGREEGFRIGLTYEKRYLTMRCDMYEAWYVICLPPTSCFSYIVPQNICNKRRMER